MPRRDPATCFLPLALLLASCSAELGVVPGTRIRCADDADCPPSHRCAASLDRCVPRGAETDPPALAAVAMSETLLRAGERAEISFEPSEALGALPVVRLVGPPDLQLSVSQASGAAYATSFTPEGSELEGAHDLLVRLVDLSGNASGDLVLGTLVFDFTAPSLAGAVAPSTDRTGAGHDLEILLSVDEDLPEAPVAALQLAGATLPLTVAERLDARTTRYIHAGTGDEPDGPASLSAVATDFAGNSADLGASAGVVFDNTPPRPLPGASVELLPGVLASGEPNPLSHPAAATIGTTVRVTVLLDDIPAVPPVLTSAPVALSFGLESAAGTRLVFAATLAADVEYPQGACTLSIAATDALGNTESSPLDAGFDVDTEPPAAPDPELVRYARVPHGAAGTAYQSRFEVAADAGAFAPCPEAPCGYLLAYDAPDVLTAARLAPPAPIAVDGSLAPIALDRLDRRAVFVAAVDAAGNLGDADGELGNGATAVAPRHISWLETLGGKVAGSRRENPHELFERRVFVPTLFQAASPEPAGVWALGIDGAGGSNVIVSRGAGTWRRLGTGDAEAPTTSGGALVYDAARGHSLYLPGASTDVWRWDGRRWQLLTVTDPEGDGDPPARIYSAAAYDEGRDVVVLYGGNIGGQPVGDTWEWDGTSFRQVTPLDPEGDGDPGALQQAAMTYDPDRRRVVLFGGAGSDELWEFDGRSWRERTASGEWPSARPFAQVAYDRDRHVLVLYGGTSVSDLHWELGEDGWTQRCAGTEVCSPFPGAMSAHAMAYDTARQRTVLLGEGRLWEWSGVAWVERCDGAPAEDTCPTEPSTRYHADMVYERHTGGLVLFGGYGLSACDDDGNTPCEGTWVFAAGRWENLTAGDAAPNPGDRTYPGLAYDEQHDRLVLLGGGNALAETPETWEWDGSAWSLMQASSYPSGALYGRPLVPGLAPGTVIGFGGIVAFGLPPTYSDELAAWDGGDWIVHPESGNGPTARSNAGLVRLDGDELMVLGGNGVFETWLLGPGGWSDLTPPDPEDRPPDLYEFGVAYDDARDAVVVFGGFDAGSVNRGDTWEWSAGSWSAPCLADACGETPPGRSSTAAVYDVGRAKVLVFGGHDGTKFNDLWEWDGESWTSQASADIEADGAPKPRSAHALAYDTLRGQALLYGGSPDSFWSWDGGAAGRPAHVAAIHFQEAGAVDPFRCWRAPARCGIEQVTISWQAGGDGDSPGARLLGWQGGGWRELATNALGTGSPAALPWSSWGLGPEQLGGLFVGDTRALYFAVTPLAANGTRSARSAVGSDYLEVSVAYRLDNCSLARDLSSAVGGPPVLISTRAAPDEEETSCGAPGAADVILAVTPLDDLAFTATAGPATDFASVLEVRTSCSEPATALFCGHETAAPLALLGGETYWIIVESSDGASGTVELDLQD